ncbi:MAG: hypothetical protein U5L45_26145 [Saprospiraceae bacterium]|nr:hypothetical protein [Saprospiraceae bacterium]
MAIFERSEKEPVVDNSRSAKVELSISKKKIETLRRNISIV